MPPHVTEQAKQYLSQADAAQVEALLKQYKPRIRALAVKFTRDKNGHPNLPPWLDEDDLFSAGLQTLPRVVVKYDPSRGASIGTLLYLAAISAMREVVRSAKAPSRRPNGRHPFSLDAVLARMSDRGDHPHWISPKLANALIDKSMSNPRDALATSERFVALRQAVHALPERYRRIVQARYFHGKKMTTIAAESGRKKSLMYRYHDEALRRLRKALKAHSE